MKIQNTALEALRVAAVTALCLGPIGLGATAALADQLANAEIKKAVAGKTVHVSTPVGYLPIRYSANGTMRARSSAIAGLAGKSADTGHWWVKNGKLCHKWNVWLKGKTNCVTLSGAGGSFRWRSASGHSGTAKVSTAR